MALANPVELSRSPISICCVTGWVHIDGLKRRGRLPIVPYADPFPLPILSSGTADFAVQTGILSASIRNTLRERKPDLLWTNFISLNEEPPCPGLCGGWVGRLARNMTGRRLDFHCDNSMTVYAGALESSRLAWK